MRSCEESAFVQIPASSIFPVSNEALSNGLHQKTIVELPALSVTHPDAKSTLSIYKYIFAQFLEQIIRCQFESNVTVADIKFAKIEKYHHVDIYAQSVYFNQLLLLKITGFPALEEVLYHAATVKSEVSIACA